jgi:hypothetical protein
MIEHGLRFNLSLFCGFRISFLPTLFPSNQMDSKEKKEKKKSTLHHLLFYFFPFSKQLSFFEWFNKFERFDYNFIYIKSSKDIPLFI